MSSPRKQVALPDTSSICDKRQKTTHAEVLEGISPIRSAQRRQSIEIEIIHKVSIAEAWATFSSPIFLTRKKRKPTKRWYGKKRATAAIALAEVIGQEVMRFYLPYQPEARRVKPSNHAEHQINLIIKEVLGFRSLLFLQNQKDSIREKIKKGEYRGLGKLLILSLFLNEVDLKLDNIGIDEKNRLVNIDGDFKFACLRRENYTEENSRITTQDFEALPFITDYKPGNWLDYMRWNSELNCSTINDKAELIDEEMKQLASFRQEINEMSLMIMLTPPTLLETLVNSYVDQEEEKEIEFKAIEIISSLVARQEQLKEAAKASKQFVDYLHSMAADTDLKKFLEQAEQFKIMGKDKLLQKSSIENNNMNIRQQMWTEFEKLRAETVCDNTHFCKQGRLPTLFPREGDSGSDLDYFANQFFQSTQEPGPVPGRGP